MGDHGAGLIAHALRRNTALRKLCLMDTLITAESMKNFREAMHDNVTLQTLDFPTTTLTNSAMMELELLQSLINNVELRRNRHAIKALCYLTINRLSENSEWKNTPVEIIRRVKELLCG